jgi:DNA repair protein RadC
MRTRLLANPDALADYEILEMLMFMGIPRRDTKPLAKALINRFGSLAAVIVAPVADLQAAGLGDESIAALRVVARAADHLAAAENIERPLLNNHDRLLEYLNPVLRSQRTAHLAVLFLNNRNQLLGEHTWPPDASAEILPGQVGRRALALHATALLLVFCHPNSGAVHSKLDVALGRQIAAAAEVLSIVLHDSLVIGRGGKWASLRQQGGL